MRLKNHSLSNVSVVEQNCGLKTRYGTIVTSVELFTTVSVSC